MQSVFEVLCAQVGIFHDGIRLQDDVCLGSIGIVNNEQLYLDFKPPWPQHWLPGEGAAGGAGGDKKGGKKKK